MINKIFQRKKKIYKNNKILDFGVMLYFVVCFILYFIDTSYLKDIYLLTVPLIGVVLLFNINKNKNDFLIFCFYISNFTFLHGMLYIKLIEEKPIYGMFFAPYKFSDSTTEYITLVLLIKVFAIFIARTFVNYFPRIFIFKKNYFKNIKVDTNKFYKIILFLVLISIVYKLKLVKTVNSLGYLSLYNGVATNQMGYWKYLKFLSIFTDYFVIIYLCLIKNKIKMFRNIVILYFFLVFLGSLSGGRGGLIAIIFCLSWYLFKYFNLKINSFKIIIGGLILISLTFFISGRRGKNSENNFKIVNLEKVEDFFEEQGGSITLIGFYRDYRKLKISEKPMIFSFLGGAPEKIYCKLLKKEYNPQRSFYNGERISSVVNYKLYKAGMGAGGNYIVEMLEIGEIIGVFLLVILYIFFIEFIQINFLKMSLFFRILSFIFIKHSFLTPRTHYLTIGITQIFYSIICYFLFILIFKNRRKNV